MSWQRYVEETYTPTLRRSSMKEQPREREIRRVQTGSVGLYFGPIRLNKITRSRVEQFIDFRREQGTGHLAINRDVSRLRHLLNDVADRDELRIDLPRIPWRRLKLKEATTHNWPVREDERDQSHQLHELEAALGPRMRGHAGMWSRRAVRRGPRDVYVVAAAREFCRCASDYATDAAVPAELGCDPEDAQRSLLYRCVGLDGMAEAIIPRMNATRAPHPARDCRHAARA